jgi:hypothetical protein
MITFIANIMLNNDTTLHVLCTEIGQGIYERNLCGRQTMPSTHRKTCGFSSHPAVFKEVHQYVYVILF